MYEVPVSGINIEGDVVVKESCHLHSGLRRRQLWDKNTGDVVEIFACL